MKSINKIVESLVLEAVSEVNDVLSNRFDDPEVVSILSNLITSLCKQYDLKYTTDSNMESDPNILYIGNDYLSISFLDNSKLLVDIKIDTGNSISMTAKITDSKSQVKSIDYSSSDDTDSFTKVDNFLSSIENYINIGS